MYEIKLLCIKQDEIYEKNSRDEFFCLIKKSGCILATTFRNRFNASCRDARVCDACDDAYDVCSPVVDLQTMKQQTAMRPLKEKEFFS